MVVNANAHACLQCTHWTLGNCVLQSPQYMNRSKILRGMQAGIRISYCCSMVRSQTSPQDIHEEMKTSDMITSSISWCLCWENLRWRGLYPTFDKYLPVGNPLLETQDKPVILTSFWKKSLSWHKYNSHNNNQLICKDLQSSLAFDPQLMPIFRHAFSAPSLTHEQKFPQSQKKKKKTVLHLDKVALIGTVSTEGESGSYCHSHSTETTLPKTERIAIDVGRRKMISDPYYHYH